MTQPGSQTSLQASGSGVPSVVKTNFSGVDYKNWLKVGMSLKLTAKALMLFCKDEMESFHNSLKTSIGSTVCSSGCTYEDIRKKKKGFTCASNVCHRWLAKIKAQCATGQFSVANTTVSLWPVHPWQLAQYYMGPGQDAANTSPLKTDPGGILQLVINCKRFHPLIDKDKVEEVRKVRNLVMHNGDFTFTTADMKKHLQCMTDLLQEPGLHAQPHTDTAANDAIDEISQIESVDIDINDAATLEFERNMWKELIADQTTNRQEIKKIIKSNEDLKKRLKDVDTELKRDIGAVKQQVEQLAKEKKDKSKPDPKSVAKKLKTALRDLYSALTVPVQESVAVDSCTQATLGDMYVDLHLQESCTTQPQETPGYRDLAELQRRMHSSRIIQLSQLFDKLHDRRAPRSVLILGRAGVGKSTLVKQMARRWAEKKLWTNAVNYLFLITLRQLQQDREWTLADLLLDGLPLTKEEKIVAVELLLKYNSKVLVIQDGLDEVDFHNLSESQRDGNKKTDLNMMLNSITYNILLKGAKVVVTTRPNDTVPECDRKTELYGFTQDSIQKYIEKFSREDTELENYIRSYLQGNANISTLCYLPVLCSFVCACLSDLHSASHREDLSAVNTMTRLYVFAAINLAMKHGMKHDPSLGGKRRIDAETFYDKKRKSLRNHAKLAKHCMMSTPLQIIIDKEDLECFDLSDEDRRIGFLAESEKKHQTACFTRPCWTFTHLTFQEMLAAVELLFGPHEELLKLVEDKALVHQREVLIKFIVGLWCDKGNEDFMKHLGFDKHQVGSRPFMEKLAVAFDTMQLATAIHESQCPSLVDLMPQKIESCKVFPTEMMALSWVLRQPQCQVTELDLMSSDLDTNLMMQLCDGLEHNTSIRTLNLSGNRGAFANEEVGRRFGAVLGLTSKKEMRKLQIAFCQVSDETLRNVVNGLCQGCPNMERLECWGNYDLTETSYELLKRLVTKLPGVEISLSPLPPSSLLSSLLWVNRLKDEFPDRVYLRL